MELGVQDDRPGSLLPALGQGRASIELSGQKLAGDELAAAAGGVARAVAGASRVAFTAHPTVHTLVTVAGILAAGGAAIPLNPRAGSAERAHILRDAAADLVLDTGQPATTPDTLPDGPPPDDRPALILYTSGSTGPPKGAVIPRRAIAANLDAIASLWDWTADDVLAHALPVFHVHGLVFGGLGPLRIGSPLVHTGGHFRAVPGASVYFGVPALWASLHSADLRALYPARLLVSGAGPVPQPVFDRVAALTGHQLLNRYAMTETLIITSPSPAQARSAQSVGPPLPGVQVRLTEPDEAGQAAATAGSPREVLVRGASLFTGYLGRGPGLDSGGWFRTGDLGEWLSDGSLRLIGRRDTDLIKTAGYRVGAGEVEDVLLGFPGVTEAAVVGLPDGKLGQRVAAWLVAAGPVNRADIAAFLATRLAPYKQPQEIHLVDALPRTALGKVQKRLLISDGRP